MIKIVKSAGAAPEALFERTTQTADVSDVVAKIIESVKGRGDEALLRPRKALKP